MPTINRIRVANVSYDNKHITDEIYDSFGGENILLNLANGSGKSVLVQMMLQPVLPSARIHGRKVEDYLSSPSSPTFILIEWKLDTLQPTYFLTGIVMCVSGSSLESSARVKYFTFTNHYTEANRYDIANIPFIDHLNNGVIYLNYDSAMKEIRQARDSSSKINYFVRDDMDRYKKELAEHGILQDEWRIIQKINEKEGGVDELFASCRTSDSLIDKWILKTVSDSISGNDNLFEMFVALMDSILEQEDNVRQKELLDNFRTRIGTYIDQLEELCGNLSTSDRIEQILVGLYSFFTQKISALEDQKNQLKNSDIDLQAQLLHIQYEELSERLYDKQRAWEDASEKAEHASNVLEEKVVSLQSASRAKMIQGAAEQHSIIMETTDKIDSYKEELGRLESSDTTQNTINLEYTLRLRYNEEIQERDTELKKTDETIAQAHEQKDSTSKILLNARSRSDACKSLSGRLEEKIESFLKREENTFRDLSFSVGRMLTGILDPSEVEAFTNHLQALKTQLLDRKAELTRKYEANNDRIVLNSQEQSRYEDSLRDTRIQLDLKTHEIERYKKDEETLKLALRGCKIPFENRFDKEINTITLNEQRRTLEERQSAIVVSLSKQREFLKALRNGSVHTDPSFGNILQKEGIEFTTGESYLKNYEKSVQDQLISRNPLLPYCFLVAKKDIVRINKLPAHDEIGRACPIFAFEDLESSLAPVNKTIFLDPVQFVCYYNLRSFGADTKDSYQETLQEEIEATVREDKHCNLELQELNHNSTIILQFPYEKGTLELLTEEEATLEASSAHLEDTLKKLQHDQKELQAENVSILEHMHRSEQEHEVCISNIARFDEYLAQNELYMETLNSKVQNDKELEHLTEDQQNAERLLEELRSSLSISTAKRRDLQETVGKYRLELDKLPLREEGTLTTGSLDVLKERYQDYLNKVSDKRVLLNERINSAAKERSSAERILKRDFSDLSESEYRSVTYSEELYNLFTTKAIAAQKEYDDANKLSIEANAIMNAALSIYRERKKDLESAGFTDPLPIDEIKGDYPFRKDKISKARDDIQNQLNQNNRAIAAYNEHRNDIRRSVDVDAVTASDITPTPNWLDLNINELSKELKETRALCTRTFNITNGSYQNIKGEFSGSHTIIDPFLEVASLENHNLDFSECYHVYERTTAANDRLIDYLKIIENALETIEKDKAHVTQHAVLQGKKLYSELSQISSSSSVKLPGRNSPQQMLKIELPDDLDNSVEERMKDHINQCIVLLRTERGDDTTGSLSIRKRVATMLSDRQLLNTTINRDTLSVKLYKVDINPNNSRLKQWENVVVQNSGGEMFVSCFILISALIAYTRKKFMQQSGDNITQGTKTFIIDNPFGKTSSRHLLEAMIEISKKFDTQMICLSDLSQSSITGQFALIYQLSVRPSLYGNKSYLKTDDVITSPSVTRNERLEHIYIKSDQITLF